MNDTALLKLAKCTRHEHDGRQVTFCTDSTCYALRFPTAAASKQFQTMYDSCLQYNQQKVSYMHQVRAFT